MLGSSGRKIPFCTCVMNQVEVVHASWVHRDSPNLSLLDACQVDVRDSVVLDVELTEYERGTLTIGTGPSYAQRKKRQHARQIQKARQMGRELLKECEDGFLIDPNSAHKPAQKQPKKVAKRKRKVPESPTTAETCANAASVMPTSTIAHVSQPAFNNVGSHHSSNLRFPQPAAQMQYPYLHNSPFYIRQPPHPRQQFSFHSSPSNQSHPWSTPVTYLPQREIWSPQQSLQWHSGYSPHPYEIVVLQASVKKCYGCGSEFADRLRHPPHNLIVRHMDKRVKGKDRDGKLVYSNDFSNTYYHPTSLHIKRKNPAFNGTVLIDNSLLNSLDDLQKQIIATYDFRIILKPD